MAIINDPDLLSRYDIIFGSESQKISVYPVGDTQRGSTVTDAYVSATGTITSGGDSFDAAVAVGDVVAVLNSVNAGHYFVETDGGASSIGLTDIDLGTSGAQITSLTANQKTIDATAISTNVFSLTTHGYVSGDAIVYSGGGGGTISELTVGNVYYIIWLSADTFSLATSYANAIAGTVLTVSTGTGTSHTFDERLLVGVFTNGAANVDAAVTPIGEFINGNETTGSGDGDVKDGVTLQAIYSYAKDEWRADSLLVDLSGNYNDDLIKTEFPFEAITSEQFEIGGGTAHDNWSWFNDYTRKKVRTGGWADKTRDQTGDFDLERWTGIVTLGSLDIDTQVYFQQISTTTPKTNFTFTGVVNESIQILNDENQNGNYAEGNDYDRRTYLKLFARKKGRSYAQSEIADIGVSTLQTIVNRFPLSHTIDASITKTDAELFGSAPYRFASSPDSSTWEVSTGTTGVIVAGEFTFTDSSADFVADGVVAGDVLRIISDINDIGYYFVSNVATTTLTVSEVEYIDTDGNFVFNNGWQTSSSNISYDVYTFIKASGTADTGIINETPSELSNGELGSLTDTAGTFATDGVIAGDLLIITGGVDDTSMIGVYTIVDSNYDSAASAPTDTTIFVNTFDKEFPAVADGAVTYQIVHPGMYLQFKDELVETKTATATANEDITFSAASRTITLGSALATWNASISAGTMIVVTTPLNTGRFTVLTRDSDTQITLITSDALVDETATSGTVEVREGFKRIIGTGTYAYRWRITGNNGSLQDVFQFVQNQLRSSIDIDHGNGSSIGNITDLLMNFATPTGTGLDMFIDSLSTNDINNATFQDHSGTNRNYPFTASGNLVFNSNLVGDSAAKYWLFFTNDDAGTNLGRDFGTKDAIIVKDSDDVEIKGDVNGAGTHTGAAGTQDAAGNISIPFTYDYDVNEQRGLGSKQTPAPVTLVAIGLSNAQYVVSAGTISRSTGITISAVSSLERNYLTGSV